MSKHKSAIRYYFTFSCSWGFQFVVKEISFFQDIAGSTSFELELTKDSVNNDQIIMAALQETSTEQATFLLLLAVWYLQPTINYKGRLRRKLTQTIIFPKSS